MLEEMLFTAASLTWRKLGVKRFIRELTTPSTSSKQNG